MLICFLFSLHFDDPWGEICGWGKKIGSPNQLLRKFMKRNGNPEKTQSNASLWFGDEFGVHTAIMLLNRKEILVLEIDDEANNHSHKIDFGEFFSIMFGRLKI